VLSCSILLPAYSSGNLVANLPARFFGKKVADNMHQLRQIVTAVWTDPYNDVKETGMYIFHSTLRTACAECLLQDSGKERPCFASDMINTYTRPEDGNLRSNMKTPLEQRLRQTTPV
jgi:hypothetical protein